MTAYLVGIHVDQPDVDDVYDVRGVIELDETGFATLDHRLYALMGEDFIFQYHIEEMDVPGPITSAGILEGIVSIFDDEARDDATELWESRS